MRNYPKEDRGDTLSAVVFSGCEVPLAGQIPVHERHVYLTALGLQLFTPGTLCWGIILLQRGACPLGMTNARPLISCKSGQVNNAFWRPGLL